MINRFTDGLPAQLAFFIRASRVSTLRGCLHVAKTGEAHGYRTVDITSVSAMNKPFKPTDDYKTSQRTCYKCNGQGHIKPNCKWNGVDPKMPNVQCQLCDQFGHSAKYCIINPVCKVKPNDTKCQICDDITHTAKQCMQLKDQGLRAQRTSQT